MEMLLNLRLVLNDGDPPRLASIRRSGLAEALRRREAGVVEFKIGA
jgi:hypothetical protein